MANLTASRACAAITVGSPFHITFINFFHPLYIAINQYHKCIGKGLLLSSMFAQGLLLSMLALSHPAVTFIGA